MVKSNRDTDIQYAALPFRSGPHGIEILLITSRETKRWIIPKGWPMLEKKPHRVAEIEAFQEAGIKGVVSKKPIGVYPSNKTMSNGEERLCFIEVCPLRVTLELSDWPEKSQRSRSWFQAQDASGLVDEGGLAQIIDEWR